VKPLGGQNPIRPEIIGVSPAENGRSSLGSLLNGALGLSARLVSRSAATSHSACPMPRSMHGVLRSYSDFRTSTGSTLLTRLAGKNAATVDTAIRTAGTPRKVTGSSGDVP